MADARSISDRVKDHLKYLSGNECANPSCHNQLSFPDDNAFDSQICHIEAASPNGPRYNPNQTDEERRSFDNLILLCYKCHNMVDNNPDKYTVELLKQWKREHEAKYQNNYQAKTFSFSVPDGLLPRNKEADNLFDKIITHRIFNLIGVGGSGKSSLAYLMMQKHEDDFNEIAYVVVNNNIKDDLVEQINQTLQLEFEKDDDFYSTIIAYLRDNFKSEHPNLLVLDINETSDKEKNDRTINSLKKNKDLLNQWKILILSRENVDTRNRIEAHNLNDKEDVEFLKQLFLSKAGARYNDFGDFTELFKTIFYNPLLSEQLGLYLNDEPELATMDDIKKILYGESFREEDMQGLSADRHDEPIVSFLINLIKYNDLNDNEKNLLRHFVLWQAEYIGYDVLKDLLKGVFESDDDLKNALKSLSKRSILTTNKDKTLSYKLHGLLAESLREQIEIEKEDYETYFDNIRRIRTYKFRVFLPYADYIGNSLSEYEITTNIAFLIDTASKLYDCWSTDYAKKLYNQCIEITNQRLETEPGNIVYLESLSSAYNNLAILDEVHLNNYKSAENNFTNAIEINEKIIKISATPKYLNLLAGHYNNLATLQYAYLNIPKSAETNFKKAIKILVIITKTSNNAEYLYGLETTYYNLAMLQDDCLNDYASAEINYIKSIKIGEKIRKISNKPEYLNRLSGAYNNFALLQAIQKKYEVAIMNCKKAIGIVTLLKDINLEYLVNWTSSNNMLAKLYFATGNLSKAQEIMNKIKPIAEKLIEDFPNYDYLQKVNVRIKYMESKLNQLSQ